jgi:hypothetical protein
LNLKGLEITDVGLKYLATLKRLTMIVFSDPKVTRAALEQLQKELPDCKIIVQGVEWRRSP